MTQKVNYDKKRADALRAMHEKRVKEAAEAAKKAKQEADDARIEAVANAGEPTSEAANDTAAETKAA